MNSYHQFLENDNERQLVEQMIRAEKVVVMELLATELTEASAIECVDHASWFASTMRARCTDPDQPPVACKAKCHWCCNQLVSVTAPEVFRAVDFIRNNLPPGKQQSITNKLIELNKQSQGKTPLERAKIKLPCALIYQGMCQIYPARPLMCQRQTSYQLKECKQAIAKGFPYGSILCERAALLTHSAAIQALYDGFNESPHGIKLEPLEMISATLAALQQPDAFEHWHAGCDVFARCRFPV